MSVCVLFYQLKPIPVGSIFSRNLQKSFAFFFHHSLFVISCNAIVHYEDNIIFCRGAFVSIRLPLPNTSQNSICHSLSTRAFKNADGLPIKVTNYIFHNLYVSVIILSLLILFLYNYFIMVDFYFKLVLLSS